MVGPLCESPTLTLRFAPATEGRAERRGCPGSSWLAEGPNSVARPGGSARHLLTPLSSRCCQLGVSCGCRAQTEGLTTALMHYRAVRGAQNQGACRAALRELQGRITSLHFPDLGTLIPPSKPAVTLLLRSHLPSDPNCPPFGWDPCDDTGPTGQSRVTSAGALCHVTGHVHSPWGLGYGCLWDHPTTGAPAPHGLGLSKLSPLLGHLHFTHMGRVSSWFHPCQANHLHEAPPLVTQEGTFWWAGP